MKLLPYGSLCLVGDSFFQGTIRVIAFGLGVALAQQGSIMGLILAMLVSIIHFCSGLVCCKAWLSRWPAVPA